MFRLIFTSFATTRFASQTRLLGGDDWLFFNYGYEEDPPLGIPLDAADEPHRYFIQLYHRTATQADSAARRFWSAVRPRRWCLVSGAHLHPASYTGLDLNPAGIEFAKNRHHLDGLDFVEGNARSCRSPTNRSTRCSTSRRRTCTRLPEIPRRSRARAAPGGHFLYTDFRPRQEVAEWEAALAKAPLRQLSMSVIDQNVLRGNEKNAPRKHARISQHGLSDPAHLRARGQRHDRLGIQGRTARRRVHLPRVLLRQGLELS